MKVLITGCGRSCTNWVSEIVKSTGRFDWVGVPEDRNLFLPPQKKLPPNYATKLATEHPTFSEHTLKILTKSNPELAIIWCIKHPVANVMSKIYRGRPASEGGDKTTENVSADGTVETAINAVKKSFRLNNVAIEKPFLEVLNIRLCDLILTTDSVVSGLAEFLNCKPQNLDPYAFENTPNRYHKKRYGDRVDKSQAHIYENWETAYGGYFADKEDIVEKARDELKGVANEWGYEI
jgi:hypothetical protein